MSKSSGSPGAPERPGPAPARFTQSQIGRLERVQDRFLREVLTELSLVARTTVTGSVRGMEEITGADLVPGAPAGACFSPIDIQDSGSGLLYAGGEIAASLIEALLGSEVPASVGRSGGLTALETTLLQAPVDKLLSALTSAWGEEIAALHASAGPVISDGRAVRVDPHDSLLRMRFDLTLGTREGELSIALPFRLTRPPEDGRTAEVSEEQQKNMLALLQHARMEFDVQAAGSRVCLAELSELRPGDVFTTGRNINDPLTALLNDQPMFSGHILVQGIRRCFVIENVS